MASPRDMILLEVWSIADLRSRSGLARIGRALDADPELRPERLAPRDPPRTPIASAAAAFAEWRPAARDASHDWYFFANRKTEPRGRVTVQIAAPMPERVALHSVTCAYPTAWFEPAERVEKLVRFFGRLVEATSAFYGRAARGAMYDQRNLLIQLAQGQLEARLFPDFEREVPDVYWLNYFGPAYLEHWGARLDGVGARRDEAAGGVIIWATERPSAVEKVAAITDYPFKEPFYRALGRDTFMSERQRPGAPGQHVPTFDAHRRKARTEKRAN
jgi:hypothetical protein